MLTSDKKFSFDLDFLPSECYDESNRWRVVGLQLFTTGKRKGKVRYVFDHLDIVRTDDKEAEKIAKFCYEAYDEVFSMDSEEAKKYLEEHSIGINSKEKAEFVRFILSCKEDLSS